MRNKKKLGIIGGLGPFATANWYKMILDIITKKYNPVQDYEYPEMYIFSLSMEGWSEKGIEDEKRVKGSLMSYVEKMEYLGVDYLIIACNTAHIFYEYLKSNTTIKIISIIDACIDFINKIGYSSVGVLCSESSSQYKLYKNPLFKNDINVISSSFANEQNMINEVILSVQGGSQGENEKKVMNNIIQSMSYNGAEAVILGCTELPLSINQKDTSVILLDSGYILLDEITNLLYG